MNIKFKEFLKTIANVVPTYKNHIELMNKLEQYINMPIKYGRRTEDPSGYIIKQIDDNDKIFVSLRFGTHLPSLKHFVKGDNGIPSDKEYAHNCLLFLGSKEYKTLGSEKGNHQMSKARTEVKVEVDMPIFEYYTLPKYIPYHIYHLIPELINENDIKLIGDSCNDWLENDGDEPFIISNKLTQNAYYRNHKSSKLSSIDCMMIIMEETNKKNKSLTEVRAYSGNSPLMTIDMGYITIVSPNREERTLHGILEVNSCEDRDVDMLNLFRFDSSLYKKRYENVETKVDMKKLYESIMKDVAYILKKHLNKLN